MIRSVTIGLPIGSHAPSAIEAQAKKLIGSARQVLQSSGYPTRTMRFTLPPVGLEGETEGALHSNLRWVNTLAEENDIRWFCVPFDFLAEGPRGVRLAAALDLVGRFPRSFLNMIVADRSGFSVPAINDVAQLVLNVARKTRNGFDNFRLGASCNCPPNTPFFPFSRHEGDQIAFSFALETTALALDIVNRSKGLPKLDVYRDTLVAELSDTLTRVDAVGYEIADRAGAEYRGLDASFAPFPDGHMSVAVLVEKLLGVPVGSQGSLMVTGLLTDALRTALKRSGARAAGFNGVMYSLLEDEGLASANNRRNLTLDALVALSTLCACGVDMVPVPGTSFPEELAAVMLDIAAVSVGLDKPLGIRLLPIPNKAVNEYTQFNLDFLCDSRVVGLAPQEHGAATAAHMMSTLTPRVIRDDL